jgi:DNA modification methylase
VNIIVPKKILGDCRQAMATLPEKHFHCSVSSPPYFGLRSYLADDHPMKKLEIGSESTLELYLEHIVEVYRCVRRVLRDDGLIWVNIGDRFTSGGRRTYDKSIKSGSGFKNQSAGVLRPFDPEGLKHKDLCMLPARVAMALQMDGWYLRAQIPWIKRNCMPESADDRPAVAIEYVFMFSKSKDYFYDGESVKMPVSQNTHPRTAKASQFPAASERDENRRRTTPKAAQSALGSKQHSQWNEAHSGEVSARNRRNSDWLIESWQGMLTDDDGFPVALMVNPKGTTLNHFASYPAKLVEPMIKASTSDGGCCPQCGANWLRVVEEVPDLEHQKQCGGNDQGEYFGKATKDYDANKVQNASDVKRRILAGMTIKKTIGFRPGCECKYPKPVMPARVLDPFHGTGTTSEVAVRLGRDYTGCEISDDYFQQSDVKDGQTALHLI